MQSLIYRHVLNQSIPLTFSLLILCFHFRSKTSSKRPFPQQHSQVYFDKTDQPAAQHRNHTARKGICAVYSVCQGGAAAAAQTLTCMGSYLHQFGKGADVTSESHSGEFLPQLHPSTVCILKHEVSQASTIL